MVLENWQENGPNQESEEDNPDSDVSSDRKETNDFCKEVNEFFQTPDDWEVTSDVPQAVNNRRAPPSKLATFSFFFT